MRLAVLGIMMFEISIRYQQINTAAVVVCVAVLACLVHFY